MGCDFYLNEVLERERKEPLLRTAGHGKRQGDLLGYYCSHRERQLWLPCGSTGGSKKWSRSHGFWKKSQHAILHVGCERKTPERIEVDTFIF
jgi:hypothetical protein